MATGATPARASGDLVADRLRAVQDLCDRGEPLDLIMAAVLAEGLTRRSAAGSTPTCWQGRSARRLDLATKRGAARRREFVTLFALPGRAWTHASSVTCRSLAAIAFHLHRAPAEAADLADGDALQKVATAAAEPSKRIRTSLRWYADLPLRDELSRVPVPAARRRPGPVTQIDDIAWSGERLRVSGHAYLAGLSVRSRRFNRATVVLRGPRWLPPVRLRTRRVFHPEATTARERPAATTTGPASPPSCTRGRCAGAPACGPSCAGPSGCSAAGATVQDTTTWRAEIVIWSRGARATGLLRGPVQRSHRASFGAGGPAELGGSVRSGPPTARSRSCCSPPGPS